MFPLYRGQRIDNKEWLVGNLVVCKPYDLRKWGINLVEPLRTYIRSLNIEWDNKGRCYRWKEYEVSPESLSMFTNQTDKNNIAIFGSFEIDGKMTRGGDIVLLLGNKHKKYTVKFPEKCNVIWCVNTSGWFLKATNKKHSFGLYKNGIHEIVGKQLDFKE
jgi:hypothetical protein